MTAECPPKEKDLERLIKEIAESAKNLEELKKQIEEFRRKANPQK